MLQLIIRCSLPAVAMCVWFCAAAFAQEPSSEPSLQDATKIHERYTPLNGNKDPHPDFILPSIDGDSSIQLSDLRGKKVLLLHFASW